MVYFFCHIEPIHLTEHSRAHIRLSQKNQALGKLHAHCPKPLFVPKQLFALSFFGSVLSVTGSELHV